MSEVEVTRIKPTFTFEAEWVLRKPELEKFFLILTNSVNCCRYDVKIDRVSYGSILHFPFLELTEMGIFNPIWTISCKAKTLRFLGHSITKVLDGTWRHRFQLVYSPTDWSIEMWDSDRSFVRFMPYKTRRFQSWLPIGLTWKVTNIGMS